MVYYGFPRADISDRPRPATPNRPGGDTQAGKEEEPRPRSAAGASVNRRGRALITGMKNNLFARFALILVIIALALLCLYFFPLKPGIDLGGGTSLLYEVQIPDNYAGDPADMTSQVIGTLKNRVDPLAQKNLIWRVVGGRRIQLQIPQVPEKVREARNAVRDAELKLRESGLTAQDLANVSNAKPGKERDELIAKLSGGWDKRETLLKDIAKHRDDLQAAEAEANTLLAKSAPIDASLMEKITFGRKEVQRLQTQLFALNVNVTQVKTLLESMATSPETSKAELDKVVESHPAQQPELKAYLSAHDNLNKFRDQNTDSPEEIQRLLQGSGKLDFRICVDPRSSAEQPARQSLAQLGPRKAIGNMRWFEIDQKGLDNFKTRPGQAPSYIVDTWGGKDYVLLYTDSEHALTHDIPGRDWRLTDADPDSDQTGQTVVSFKFDNMGASFFSDLTGKNVGKPMAILLDDKAMQAPNINSIIPNGRGQISFGRQAGRALMEEVENLVKILRAGSLSAALVPEPISVQEISPSMGLDNIRKGFWSSFFALVVVVGFMFVYYTLTGSFADVALVINLLITIAVMALLGATFTLPGIAGLVLTLGMAVDANVLINERIREEIHKGGSLWMAVKQGYDRVFWTIFDSNLTTALTSVVLIFVGSEEVKGFGVTLIIGLAISMFTALFVTRTLMIAAVRWNILRAIDDHTVSEYFKEIFTFTWLRNGHWPFMKVITVSNIDWIGKRYYFWTISAIITIAGLLAFYYRGEDKYDTEFRGGTQVTFSTPDKMDIGEVRKKVASIAENQELVRQYPEFKGLESATVYAVGNTGTVFELQTEIADTTSRKIKQPFLDALAAQFPNEGAMVKINTGGIAQDPRQRPRPSELLRTLMDSERVVPIKVPLLSANFPSTMAVPPKPVDKYVGGVAMYFDQLNPPQSIEDLTARLKATKTSGGGTFRTFEVIPAHEVPAKDAHGKPAYDAVVVVAFDDQIAYDPSNLNSGWDKVAEQELTAALHSFEPRSPFVGVNSIDAVVAGQAKTQALLAIVISLAMIVIYVWIRFGGIRYGYGAILSLAHDAIMALAATVLAKYIAETWLGQKLLIADFKINLTMIAAYLTVIGYSVNDTIVIFDRIRENRGRSHQPLTAKLVNDSINQCFGRTIWTTFTVFIVLVIMYIWGGEGIRGFSFAMLIGVFTGAYSTLAIASPMLLTVKDKAPAPRTTLPKGPSGPDGGVSAKTPVPAT